MLILRWAKYKLLTFEGPLNFLDLQSTPRNPKGSRVTGLLKGEQFTSSPLVGQYCYAFPMLLLQKSFFSSINILK